MSGRNVPRGTGVLDRLARLDLILLAIVAGGTAFSSYFTTQGREWVVMTDELQTVKLAASVADSLSPLPQLHGEHVNALSQLYPLLIAPFVALLSMPAAIDAIHVFNAFLIAVAAWPAFLLTLDVTCSRLAAYLVAAATAVLPWAVLATTITTPVAAYPVTVWAVLLMYRALVEPTPGREAAALAAIGIAFFARTQLVVLALVFPVAVLVHELGLRGARRSWREHRVLAGAFAVGLLTFTAVAAAGRTSGVLGSYSVTAEGDLLPNGVWTAAISHVIGIAVPMAMLPLVLALGWCAAVLGERAPGSKHAYASLLAVLVPVVAVQVASFDLRFTPGGFPQGRYLFFLVPLILVASAACLVDGRRRAIPAAVAALVVAAAIGFAHLGGIAIYWAAPSTVLQLDYARILPGSLELSLRALTLLGSAAVIALLLWARRPAALVAVFVGLFALFAVEAGHLFAHEALPQTTRRLVAKAVRPDWIDAALPRGTSVALVPAADPGPALWWDTEYWNERVNRSYSFEGATTNTPFPARRLQLDVRTGRLLGDEIPRYAVFARTDVRFRPAGSARVAATHTFELLRIPRGATAEWATGGLTPDGWTHGPAQILVFPRHAGPARQRVVTVRLGSLGGISGTTPYRVRFGGRDVARGVVRSGTSRTIRFAVCVGPDSPGAARLVVRRRSQIIDGRIVGLRVERITTAERERPCRSPE